MDPTLPVAAVPENPASPSEGLASVQESTSAPLETAPVVPPAAVASFAANGAVPTPSKAAPPAVAPGDVAALVARARAAQAGWASVSIEDRVRALAPLKSRILDSAEAIGAEVHRETGKPEVEALLSEVLPSADVADFWALSIEELMASSEVELDRMSYPGKTGWIYREARGTVGLITPWNYPVALPLRTLVPALLAGNAVVWKPSEVTPGSGALVARLFDGLLPEGVLTVAHGAGDVGQALAESDLELVVFVGGVTTGRKVARACAERLAPCALELGGKDAAIVLADANLERAANGVVWGALTNAGQNCGAIERVYVESGIAEAFIAKVNEAVSELRPDIDVGPMTTERQRALVASQVESAVAHGGQVLQGEATDARYIKPVVLRVSSDESSLMQEETFGPVIPIAVVANAEEGVARANASRFGLTASIWTKDTARAEAMAHTLRAGVVTINNHAFTGALPGAPWTGHGHSGYGITGSPLALDTLTRPRFVLTDTSSAKRELWWYPYTPSLRQVALSMALVRSGSTGIFAKISAFFSLLGGFMKRFAK